MDIKIKITDADRSSYTLEDVIFQMSSKNGKFACEVFQDNKGGFVIKSYIWNKQTNTRFVLAHELTGEIERIKKDRLYIDGITFYTTINK